MFLSAEGISQIRTSCPHRLSQFLDGCQRFPDTRIREIVKPFAGVAGLPGFSIGNHVLFECGRSFQPLPFQLIEGVSDHRLTFPEVGPGVVALDAVEQITEQPPVGLFRKGVAFGAVGTGDRFSLAAGPGQDLGQSAGGGKHRDVEAGTWGDRCPPHLGQAVILLGQKKHR